MKMYLYFILNGDEECIYVGQTSNLESRIDNHRSRFLEEFVSYYSYEYTASEIDDEEAKAIVELNPKYNKSLPRNNLYIRGNELSSLIKEIIPQIVADQESVYLGLSTSKASANWYNKLDLNKFVSQLAAKLEVSDRMRNVKITYTVD